MSNENKPVKDLMIPEELQEKFDLVVKECSGALSTGVNSIKDSLVVMNGIRSLKAFFKTPEIQELVEMSQESPAGFLTDRSEKNIFKHNKNPDRKYDMKPYSYAQIVEALIPCCLEGYRMHGNEINIISGKGMPVKAGKFRRILEMTEGFRETISTPAVKDGHAFIKCKAKWVIEGREQSIGYEDGDEVHIKVKFGKWDSLDKARGLAQSKLYSQVLTRITGRFIAEEPDGVIIPNEDTKPSDVKVTVEEPEPPKTEETTKPKREKKPESKTEKKPKEREPETKLQLPPNPNEVVKELFGLATHPDNEDAIDAIGSMEGAVPLEDVIRLNDMNMALYWVKEIKSFNATEKGEEDMA